jgi:hypothetical protein
MLTAGRAVYGRSGYRGHAVRLNRAIWAGWEVARCVSEPRGILARDVLSARRALAAGRPLRLDGRTFKSGHLHHLLKLPARRGETGPEPSHPRSSISTPSHSLHRRSASGRAICCPCTNEISRRRQSEIYPRTWGSFLKQCHSPLDLRQNSLSVSPPGVSSIGSEYTRAITKCLIQPGAGRVVGGQRVAMVIGKLSAISRQQGSRTGPIPALLFGGSARPPLFKRSVTTMSDIGAEQNPRQKPRRLSARRRRSLPFRD